MVLCRIVPPGSVPHRYRANLNFVCGSLRFDVVYNLDEDSKNVFKNNVVCMILIRNVVALLRISILLGPHRQKLPVSGTESVGTILHNTSIPLYWGFLPLYASYISIVYFEFGHLNFADKVKRLTAILFFLGKVKKVHRVHCMPSVSVQSYSVSVQYSIVLEYRALVSYYSRV